MGGRGARMTAGLRFRVLGPIEVIDDVLGAVPVGGPKERMVLAQLLARANSTVSLDALIEGAWAGRPPHSAERSMHTYVARLRKALQPERQKGTEHAVLVTEGRGYRLEVEAERFDALRFEALARRGASELEAGDATSAATTLRAALALWAGTAYAEFADLEAIAPEARRLDELRLLALEDRIDADLVTGSAAELIPELEALVGEHPFRERVWGQLMLALYRAGRQRDALAAYQRARNILVNELGIEPGPELRRLEASILDQDPALDARRGDFGGPRGLPVALEVVGPAFVGREGEIEWLGLAWADAIDGRGRFISVLGPEGIGKTRLLAELGRRADAEDGVVLYGRCDHAHRGARALLDQALRSGGASLGRLDDGGPVDDPAAAVARFLPGWAGGRPVLLVLDDLHLADAETLEVIADLAGWCAAEPMLVVGAFRTDAEVVTTSPTGPVAVSTEATAQLVLDGLDRGGVARICALYADGDWSAGDVARLHHNTGGVPLRVHEEASELARQRATLRAEDATDRLTGARVRLAASRAEVVESVEGIGRLLEQRRAQLAGRTTAVEPRPLELCPYKGLARFETADASDFFGRERLVAELVSRLPGAGLLTVFGPSGSGKSSLVRAGVLPALAAGVLPGTDTWRTVTMCPGTRPARELERQLRITASPSATDRLLVFVDQFEETFTLCADDAERQRFIDALMDVIDRPGCVVVIAIRADHLGRLAAYPALGEQLTSNDVLVGPMRDHELRRVIELPARRARLELEPGLVEVIVGDVAGRAGALPLLSTALAETWERRDDHTITLAGYRAAGGVNGALARMAEDAYLSLPDRSRAAARAILLRLSDAGDDGAVDLRRRLPVADVANDGDADARRALSTLVDRRLLTVDRDTVEVAHEALLREWPRLRAWLDEDVQGRRLHRRLGDAARSWDASGHDPSELYRGTRLDGAVDWAGSHLSELNAVERSFLDASRAEAERDLADTKRRMADKAKSNRRLRGSLIGVGVLLVVALVIGVLAIRQRDRAGREARAATVGELANASALAVQEDPELAILLARQAVDVTRSVGEPVLPQARAALQYAVQSSRLELRSDGAALSMDASPDGTLLVTASVDLGATEIRDAASLEVIMTMPNPPGNSVNDVDISPDGRLVATAYRPSDDVEDAEQSVPAIVWDVASGNEIARLTGPSGYYVATISPDGRLVATSADVGVEVWDIASSTRISRFEPEGGPGWITFLDDGSLLVPAREREQVGIYAIDGSRLDVLPTPGFTDNNAPSVDPTGHLVALASQPDQLVQVWDLHTHQLVRSIAVADVGGPEWSPDGTQLAIPSGNLSDIRIVDLATGTDSIVLRGHESGVTDVAYLSPERLASVGWEGGLRVWDVSPDGSPAIGALRSALGNPSDIWVSPDGSEVVVGSWTGGYQVFDVATGVMRRSLSGQLAGYFGSMPASPDWRSMASVDATDGTGFVRDMASLAPVRELPACAGAVGFSEDSSLLVLDGWRPCDREGNPHAFPTPPGADRTSRVIEVDTGRVILELGNRPVWHAAFNPGGPFDPDRFLAVNINLTEIEIYDMRDRKLVTTLTEAYFGNGLPVAMSFNPEGTLLAGSLNTGTAWVADLAALVGGAPVEETMVFRQTVHNAATDADMGRDGLLATAAGDSRVRLWDVESGALVLDLRNDLGGDCCRRVVFSPDGDYLYYSDGGDIVRRLPLDVDELVELADSRVTRELTDDECRQYVDANGC